MRLRGSHSSLSVCLSVCPSAVCLPVPYVRPDSVPLPTGCSPWTSLRHFHTSSPSLPNVHHSHITMGSILPFRCQGDGLPSNTVRTGNSLQHLVRRRGLRKELRKEMRKELRKELRTPPNGFSRAEVEAPAPSSHFLAEKTIRIQFPAIDVTVMLCCVQRTSTININSFRANQKHF